MSASVSPASFPQVFLLLHTTGSHKFSRSTSLENPPHLSGCGSSLHLRYLQESSGELLTPGCWVSLTSVLYGSNEQRWLSLAICPLCLGACSTLAQMFECPGVGLVLPTGPASTSDRRKISTSFHTSPNSRDLCPSKLHVNMTGAANNVFYCRELLCVHLLAVSAG